MSKYQKPSPGGYFKHKHCTICGLPLAVNKEFCSIKCEDEHKRLLRRRRYTFIFMMAMFPAIVLLLSIVGMLFRG